ncbi:hypothetical protein SDJN02_23289 [Cucurbita argyrosperma subsp. argyrosperma]|uniref:Uncharacterized protein LOC111431139 n=2 Tax=Cucurbita TaxID=3660 RepID=A0A6J1E6U2_CUCMO|nr:uncharacterized protein LOC111431139 [Cucurbita moschata]XP_023551778.1 uncharacterized protein LOC111809636 [Cucurbita pepo subsp. pepo]XP_023551779.1 uncharacterized protein LOC111809636 [Cucurbita pepo subsp. pepo]KAG7015652.1 hypothetical protein SDJN02_23289 [Cucurbita argyrosperma subsp. argyrosperma]
MGDFSIQISSNLVNMLIDDTEKPKRKPRRNRTKEPQVKVDQKHVSDDSGMLKGSTSDGWPHQAPPLFLPIIPPVHSANPELDAIRSILQESERVVEKLQKQEDNMVQEVTQRAKELHDKEFKLPYQKPMPCVAESEACFQCYKDHPNDSLKCAHLVKSFENCNRQARQKLSSSSVEK